MSDEHQIIPHHILAQVTASHCCICRATLTDAISVQNGIGPICGSKYYNPSYEPTQEQVRNALGLVVCADLAPHIVDAFLKLVNNDRANARKGCNLLVYWASCNYDKRDEVFKCSAIIRALGYATLADKLEIDRTEGVIFEREDYLEAFLPYAQRLERDLKQIPGAKPLVKTEETITGQLVTTPVKRGHKVGWTIPKAEESHFECVLGVDGLGGKLVCGTRGLRTIAPRRWSELLAYRKPTPLPVVQGPKIPHQLTLALRKVILAADPIYVVEGMNFKLKVITPYNSDFVAKLKFQIPYKFRAWDFTNKWWEVSVEYQKVVLQLLQDCYGVTEGTTP